MEPPAAVAEFKDGKVLAYAAVQDPQSVQDTVGKALGIDPKDVTCHVTLLGGGFGRKSKPDYVAEAAILSKKVGKPVKVVWSREDDLRFDYYHSVAAMYMKAATDAKGRPTRLTFTADQNVYGGIFFVDAAAGTVHITYGKNSATAVFNGRIYVSGLTNPFQNVDLYAKNSG